MNIGRKIGGKIKWYTVGYHTTSSTKQWTQPAGYDTNILIYNCIARKKVPLIIRDKNIATWYSCGPTVYSSSHIGHASYFVKQDILQRILRQYFQINLVTAMNITDIDDKIIRQSQKNQEHWRDLTQRYENEFWNDMKNLGVLEPDITVRVSDFIPNIISFVHRLIELEMAYTTPDHSVYFDISRYPSYGKLQNIGTEYDTSSQDPHKKSPADFVLWKSFKPNEPFWQAPWGKGRPGWHIECSAMASHLFGSKIDFHSGGLDLRFPHHENEETQSCAYHNTDQWVNYWLHTGKLHISGQTEKMSKSLNNTISIDEMLAQYEADQFRMACLLSNWHNQMDFSGETMLVAGAVLKKFQDFYTDVDAFVKGLKPQMPFISSDVYQKLAETSQCIDESLKDNFNTFQLVECLHSLVKFTNKLLNVNAEAKLTEATDIGAIKAVSLFVEKYFNILGINVQKKQSAIIGQSSEFQLNAFVDGILAIRGDLRNEAVNSKNKDLFKHCDSIRNLLKSNCIEIKDHEKQSSWSFTSNKK